MRRFKLTRSDLVLCAAVLALSWCVAVLAQSTTQPTTEPSTPPAETPLPTAPARDEGWVSGTVLSVEGQPMANLEIRAERMEPIQMGGGAAASKWPKIVKTTTDDTGGFQLRNLEPAKQYTLIAGSNEIGWVYEEVGIQPGKEIKLGSIKMVKLD